MYQRPGKTIYIRKNSYGYDVVIIEKNGKGIVSVIGGNAKNQVRNTLKSMEEVKQMLNRNGGYHNNFFDV